MTYRWLAICLIGLAARAPPVSAQPSLEGLTLEAAIEVLEAEGLTIFYSSDLVKPAMRVTRAPATDDLRELLRSILAPHGLTTAPGPRGSVLIIAAPPTPPSAVTGSERRAAEPAPTAHDGPAGVPAPIDEIVVAASRYDLVRGVGVAPLTLSSLDLEHLPDLGDDALRAVQRLPGAAANGFSALAHVRGGAVDETLVLLDGVRLYDPFHLGSFQSIFSIIDPRIVSTMAVYTGGFPAMFGDRMSGVIDIALLDPPAPRYHEIAVSFFNASALSAGEFAGGDGEWVASIRRSNLDLLYNAFSEQPERPRYVDGFGSVGYRLGDALRISASTLYSRDDVDLADDLDAEERALSRDEDRYAWLRFDHTLSALQGNTRLAHSTLARDRNGVSDKQGISSGRVVDRRDFTIDTLDTDWAWQPRSALRWLVQFGGTLARSHGRYSYADDVELELLFDAPGAAQGPVRTSSVELAPRSNRYALYGSGSFRPTERFMIDLGVRWDRRTVAPGTGGSIVPRLGLRYGFAPRTSLRAAWGRFEQSQEINELAVGDGEVQFGRLQRAEHRVLGLEHEFASGVRLGAEAYAKRMTALRPRYENLLHSLTLLPELKPDRVRIAPDSATARGVELRVEAASDAPFRWWATYSRSSVKDSSGGVGTFRSWDQTDALGGGVIVATPRWHVAAALTYRSGWPETAALGLGGDGGSVPSVSTGPRNAERVASFRSVDLRLTRIFAMQRGELSAFLEINNAFDHRNPCCMEYQVELDENPPALELTPVDFLPRVPSLGFVWSF